MDEKVIGRVDRERIWVEIEIAWNGDLVGTNFVGKELWIKMAAPPLA